MSEQDPRQRREPVEDLSFGSLRDELGDVFPARQEIAVPEVDEAGEALSLAEQERLREKKEWEAKINARVLGESGASTPPMWIKGFVLVGVSVFLLFFLVLNSGFASFQPLATYVTMVVAGGTALWNGNGILKDDEPRDKALAAAGALVGLGVLLYAWMRLGA